ncbi:MAG: hypothetical protein SWY16_21020 [Cyanobacteriota bacterium]|nr:hypothetical protein [Cyanobacteriota bacterium]
MNHPQSSLQLLASFEQLVRDIITIDKAWKVACEMGTSNSQIATSMKNIRTRWQVRLLRLYAPDLVYLQLEADARSDEDLYELLLREPVNSCEHATHISVRVARSMLSIEEITKFSQI